MTVRVSADGVPRIFRFLPCAISMVTGESGAGKSFMAMWCAWKFLEAGGHVFSNVVIGQLQADGHWDDTRRPTRYHYAESWAEFFGGLSEVLMEEKEARCLLIIDEAATSLSAYDWRSETAGILRGTGTLKRKWGQLHIMVIAMRDSLILKAAREKGEEGGLLDMRFLKDRWAVERYGGFLLGQAYSQQEIVVIDRGELAEHEAYTFTFADQLARPLEMCKPGDYAFASYAQASWGLGKHPHTPKGRWSWRQFLAIQSGIWPDRIPRLMYDFWHKDPTQVHKLSGVDIPEVEAEKLQVDEGESTSTQKGGIVREVERVLLERGRDTNMSQIGRELGVSQPFVSMTRKRLIKEGRL